MKQPPRHANKQRRSLAALGGLLLLLSACGSSPKVHYFQLRAEAPELATPASAPQASTAIWALGPVQVPEYLDRDAIVRPSGLAALHVTPSERWAEPLRDAIPRLLQQDLAQLLGSARVWRLPLPTGLQAGRQLRVEIQRLDAAANGQALVLQARCTLIDTSGRLPPQVVEHRIEVPVGDGSTDALVAAHRRALWSLAGLIAKDTHGYPSAASNSSAGTT